MKLISWMIVVFFVCASTELLASSLFVNFNSQKQNNSLFVSRNSFGTTRTTKHDINTIVLEEAQKNKISPYLIHAIIKVESAYNIKAVSNKGAMGLMQLTPDTAKRYGVKNAFNAKENIQGGTRYLKYLLKRFDNLENAIASYNAGEGAVAKYKGIPPYQETKNYVKKVMAIYRKRISMNT